MWLGLDVKLHESWRIFSVDDNYLLPPLPDLLSSIPKFIGSYWVTKVFWITILKHCNWSIIFKTTSFVKVLEIRLLKMQKNTSTTLKLWTMIQDLAEMVFSILNQVLFVFGCVCCFICNQACSQIWKTITFREGWTWSLIFGSRNDSFINQLNVFFQGNKDKYDFQSIFKFNQKFFWIRFN